MALTRVRLAHERALAELSLAHGRPLRSSGALCAHAVLAVGPLATGELALGAPLGLLFLYETDDGQSEGARGLSPSLPLHAFFERCFGALARELEVAGLELDLSVRPEGSKGPLCNSLDALCDYLERFGGPAERRALARVECVAGDLAFSQQVLDELAPFVFRRSLDAALVASLTATPAERLAVADLVDTMAAGFGGRHASLRTGTTGHRLAELARLRLLDAADAARLVERHEAELEGRPSSGQELADIISGLAALTTAGAPLTGTIARALDPATPEAARHEALTALGFRAPVTAKLRLDALSRHPDALFHWRHAGREGSLAAALIEHASVSGDPDQVLLSCEALTHLLRHQPHVGARLASDPARLARLVSLFARDPVVSRRLLGSPSLLSSLVLEGHEAIDPSTLWAAVDRSRAARELLDEARVLAAWSGRGQGARDREDLELEVVRALFCELADVETPAAAPLVLLAKHEADGLELAALLPDGADAEVRALLRRLVVALSAGREGPLVEVRPDAARRPFTVSELAHHLAAGGTFPGGWQVLVGPPHLVDLMGTLTGAAAPTAVMAGPGPA